MVKFGKSKKKSAERKILTFIPYFICFNGKFKSNIAIFFSGTKGLSKSDIALTISLIGSCLTSSSNKISTDNQKLIPVC